MRDEAFPFHSPINSGEGGHTYEPKVVLVGEKALRAGAFSFMFYMAHHPSVHGIPVCGRDTQSNDQ